MSDAELTIRLVDASPEEQAAIDRRPDDPVFGFESNEESRSTVTSSAQESRSERDRAIYATTTVRDALDDVRDAIYTLTERFAANSFAIPIERLINAITGKSTSTRDEPEEKYTVLPGSKKEPEATVGGKVQLDTKKIDDAYDRLFGGLTTLNKTLLPDAISKPLQSVIDRISPDQDRAYQRAVETRDTPVVDHYRPKEASQSPDVQNPSSTESKSKSAGETRTEKTFVSKSIEWIRNHSRTARTVIDRASGGYKLGSRVQAVVKNVAARVGKTKIGQAAISRVAKSGFGKAVAAKLTTTAAASGATATAVGSGAASASAGGASAGGGVAAAAIANPVGLTVAAVVASFAAVAIAAKGLNDALVSAADGIEGYSPDVSYARSRTRMNTELNMLDRAKRIGPELGQLESSKGALGGQMERLWTEILALLTKGIPMLQLLVDGATLTVANTRQLIAYGDVISAKIQEAVASITPGGNDDVAAAIANKAAMDNLRQIQQEIVQLMQNIQGGQQPQGGMDPMFLSILQTDLDARGNPIKKGGI